MTGHDPLDEIFEAVPDGSVMMQPSGTMMGPESTGFHAEVCLYATEGEEKSIKTLLTAKAREQISVGLKRIAIRQARAVPSNPAAAPSQSPHAICPDRKRSPMISPCPSARMPTAHGPLSEIPERASHQACSAASTERVEAILDTGASRCVIGDRLLEQFLHQMPKSTRAQVRESPTTVKFRFGNNGTLTSTKRVYLPLQSTCGKMLWMGVEVVPSQTPFLFSKRVLKQLDGTLCTRSDTCWLGRLGIQLDLSTNISGLYLIDVAKLCTSVKKPAASVQLSASADAHVIQGSPNTEYEVGNSSVLSESPRTPAVHVNDTKPSTGDTISCSVIPATQETCQRANMLLSEACRSSPRQRSRSPEPLLCDHAPLRGSRCDSEPAQDGCHSHRVAPSPHADRDRIHGAAPRLRPSNSLWKK